jgi:hypothetical protein
MGHSAMRNKGTTTEWMAGALVIGLAIVIVVRLVATPGGKIGVALQATARWSFILFWLGYTGNALNVLFGARFQAIARHCRDFSLSYASAHLPHLGMVAWLLFLSDTPFSRSALIFFGIAVFWTYFLALLSIKSLAAKLDPTLLRILRTVGVEYIALVFLVDFAKNPFQGDIVNLLIYLPFISLAIAGPLLRFAAVAKRLAHARTLAT